MHWARNLMDTQDIPSLWPSDMNSHLSEHTSPYKKFLMVHILLYFFYCVKFKAQKIVEFLFAVLIKTIK